METVITEGDNPVREVDRNEQVISETVTTSIPVLKDLTVSGAVHRLWVVCAALCTCRAGRGISMAPYA